MCPALKCNEIIKLSWILTAEGQHTTSVHQCVVRLSAAVLPKNTEHRQHLGCCCFVCMRHSALWRDSAEGLLPIGQCVAVRRVGALVKQMLLYDSAFKAVRELFYSWFV